MGLSKEEEEPIQGWLHPTLVTSSPGLGLWYSCSLLLSPLVSERRPANMWLSSVSYLVLSLAPCICSPAGNTDCSQSHRTVLTVLQDCGRGRQNCMFLPHSSLTLCPLKLPLTVVFCFFFPLTWKASSISTIPPGRALCR